MPPAVRAERIATICKLPVSAFVAPRVNVSRRPRARVPPERVPLLVFDQTTSVVIQR